MFEKVLGLNALLKKVRSKERWCYLIRGITRRLLKSPYCPSCGSEGSDRVDRGWLVYTLERCRNCGLLYRFPCESQAELIEFYEGGYDQPGLTTDLPSAEELNKYIANNFSGTEKDFQHAIDIFKKIRLKRGSRILDYGANWGYGTFQFKKAGYETVAYDIARNRARFGRKLGVDILHNFNNIKGKFDISFSSHVLEHIPNPRKALLEQYGKLKNEGLLIAYVPNGSYQLKNKNFKLFHSRWGRVHPVLINEEYIQKIFPNNPIFFSSGCESKTACDPYIESWDRKSVEIRPLNKGEMFFIVVKG